MRLHTRLPVSHIFFKHWTVDDREIGVVIAKAQFNRTDSSMQLRAASPVPLVMEDQFEGDPAWTPLVHEQDIAPAKVGTDLTIRTIARAPDHKPRSDWAVSISVPDRLTYGFQVRGPSVWSHSSRRGWHRQTAEPITQLPITYALAAGGKAPTAQELTVDDFNPSGIGLVTKELLDKGADIPIPQIGALAEFMTDDPMSPIAVQGFGPVAKAWMPRRAFAGTFDKEWQRERHPRMPLDYNYRFWNMAPRPLQIEPPLNGDEEIIVSGISHREDSLRMRLPGARCGLRLDGREQVNLAMTLDTVMLDMQDQDQQAHSATLIWRTQITAPDRFSSGEIVAIERED